MVNGIFYGVTLLLTFGLTVLISRYLIPFLKSKKMGQKILDIGPRWHKNKEGTPTMGGLAFILATVITMIVILPLAVYFGAVNSLAKLLLVFGYALANGLIGIVDDTAKFKKGKNQGLTAGQKYLLQLLAACAFLVVGIYCGVLKGRPGDALYIPFVGDVFIFGNTVVRVLYYIFCLLLLTGMVNAVNLTDGIDGLASSVTLVVGLAYSVMGMLFGTGTENGVFLWAATLVGGCGGFLVYNFYPAKVFMGDTGSLYLGGMVVALGFVMGNPLIIIAFGLVYILETLSVILQVGYFKLTHGKRLFKMSPIHHHFEKCGWSEIRIVSVFSAVTVLAAALGILDIFV